MVLTLLSFIISESQRQCKKMGAGWDLAIIDDQEELDYIVEITKC